MLFNSSINFLLSFIEKKLCKEDTAFGPKPATLEIKSYLYKLYSFPIYLMLMSIIGCILMLNIKYNKSKIFHIIIGIIFSVLVYYVNYFSNLLKT